MSRTQMLLLVVAATVLVAPAAAHRRLSGAKPALLGMQDAQKGRNLRILAFGDSLTEGWIDTLEVKHPYTWQLEPRLRERLAPKGISVQVTNGGVGSAGVLDRLNDAWYGRLRDARAAGKPYHYVIFLAGINDILRQHRAVPDIMARMEEMWNAAAKEGTTVIVIPTLPTNMTGAEPDRSQLANRIRSAAAKRQKAGDTSVVILDLDKSFDPAKLPAAQWSKISDDGLHMTDYGYQQLASLIYDGLVKILKI